MNGLYPMEIKATMFDTLCQMCSEDAEDAAAYVYAFHRLASNLEVLANEDFTEVGTQNDDELDECKSFIDEVLCSRTRKK